MTHVAVPSMDQIYHALLTMPESMVLTQESWRRYAEESLWEGMLLRTSILSTGLPGEEPAWHAFAHGQRVEVVRSMLGLWFSELLMAPLDAETVASLTASSNFAENAMYWAVRLHACATSADPQTLQELAAVPPKQLVLPDFLIAWTEMCVQLRRRQAPAHQQPTRATRVRRVRTGPAR